MEESSHHLRRLQNKISEEGHLKFLHELFQKGMTLSWQQIADLEEAGLIPKSGKEKVDKEDKKPFDSLRLQHISPEVQKQRVGDGYYVHCGREIETKEWFPDSVMEHSKEFVSFITSMIEDGFQKKTHYKPLELYVQQAHNWLSDVTDISDFDSETEKWDYFEREFQRCSENSLYYLDKYLYIKEPDMLDADNMKYTAKPVHEVMAFLFDCGYSIMMGKPRQVAATTTYLGLALKKLIFRKNTFIKFVTMDVDKAEQIMEDKLKYPTSQMPDYLTPAVSGDSKEGLQFGRKIPGKKGKRGGANSRFDIAAPTVSAVNSGAPQIVMVDEAGYIKVVGKMIRESRPTMFKQDLATGKLKMVRQLIVWSTGGTEEGKNKIKTKAFEEEYYACLDKWKKGEYNYGIIPIFFDWTTRPGITKEFYESERKNYTVDGPNKDQVMNQFRLTYPSRVEDMFLSESKLLVPINYIHQQEDRINAIPAIEKPQPGYFEPIYDYGNPSQENDDVPYKIIGSHWVPTEPGDPRTSTLMFMHPEKEWRGRYFAGTDPISSDNGYSNMSTAVFDKKLKTLSAIVNYRDENHKYTFLQCLLCRLYYGQHSECPELIESNIGTAYIDYIDYKGFYNELIYKTQLPDLLQGGQAMIGIDNRGIRNRNIINKLYEFILAYGDRIYFLPFFAQLRTFTCSVTDAGSETWGTVDKRRYHDDILFSVVYAYICSLCYDGDPKNHSVESEKYYTTHEITMDRNGNLTRVPIKNKF